MNELEIIPAARVMQQLMTPEDLARVPNGEVFCSRFLKGNFFGFDGTYLFVAKKGGIEDWAVYGLPVVNEQEHQDNPHINPKLADFTPWYTMISLVLNIGLKLTSKEYIRMVVPCTDAMYNLYRH